ncbi:hypothetical protein [Methylacidimicrobium tartarophylax]|uniref:Uncharacterized protein n=1 Tax=Methylacidimicrobium tartarophylax TaxID=1041768 RepID=A0A5E6MDQ5_9BACT|nr:hypothetical protein [Methylacidimicrobium tartarophylax]VVM07102.1 hypothetical protein MAMT_01565 [Methylacidimicrobium tartarophylax]
MKEAELENIAVDLFEETKERAKALQAYEATSNNVVKAAQQLLATANSTLAAIPGAVERAAIAAVGRSAAQASAEIQSLTAQAAQSIESLTAGAVKRLEAAEREAAKYQERVKAAKAEEAAIKANRAADKKTSWQVMAAFAGLMLVGLVAVGVLSHKAESLAEELQNKEEALADLKRESSKVFNDKLNEQAKISEMKEKLAQLDRAAGLHGRLVWGVCTAPDGSKEPCVRAKYPSMYSYRDVTDENGHRYVVPEFKEFKTEAGAKPSPKKP